MIFHTLDFLPSSGAATGLQHMPATATGRILRRCGGKARPGLALPEMNGSGPSLSTAKRLQPTGREATAMAGGRAPLTRAARRLPPLSSGFDTSLAGGVRRPGLANQASS